MPEIRPIRKLLAANRSEIAIRVFRSAHELDIRTVAIYAHEDRYALHRFKADEAYPVGKPGEPIRSYLNIPAIVELCRQNDIDAVHPGYGFLSENPEFARALEAAGILFVGPSVRSLEVLGDKTAARNIAVRAGVPVLGGTKESIVSLQEAQDAAARLGFPVILKAAKGGGGRGMRVVRTPAELPDLLDSAQREAKTAFGSDEVFLEKFIERARHIEVQLLGDRHGNLLHLWERDCSVQRRHQKVVELAPAPNLPPSVRQSLCDAAVKIGREVGYENAGTVEFLLDADSDQYYFIEVNPRIQVEHTVTEEVTGIDIVKSQILVAQGHRVTDQELGLPAQSEIRTSGFAVQCRVTTEDASNQFRPDYGRISHYRSAGGLGIRLDAGSAFSGAVVNPFYDSMLVKVSARGRTLREAAGRMERCLQEFRVRGVKTNIPFLIRLVTHPNFLEGKSTTRMLDQTPELFELPKRKDRATKLLSFLADTIVNGNPLVAGLPKPTRRDRAPVPMSDRTQPLPRGSRDVLREQGVKGLVDWIGQQKQLLLTDTTMRDAHQSLLATRLRTYDMMNIASAYARLLPQMFSLEMWGGATFDTSMRFLKECPWQRLSDLRAVIPNICFQMLLRASSAVGYTNYPDNVVQHFVKESVQAGMDIFRIFDALNWLPNMRVAMDAVIQSGGVCEAAICYSGDILNPKRTKYTLKYYVEMAKQLERMGAHLLAIKDMAGLCKPEAARQLVRALRQEVAIPIHFHTHDTAGIQAASILAAASEGLPIADAAFAPLSGGTSQVNLNGLVESLRFTPRDTAIDCDVLTEVANYWQAVRECYTAFDGQVLPATGDLYQHEMPGGQYTNLYQQARSLGLESRWPEICKMYAEVNQLLGDIVKVTPSSKAVGDLALFMISAELTPDELLKGSRPMSMPLSVRDLVAGRMGQPPGGFPSRAVEVILQGEKQMEGRPGELLPPADLDAARSKVATLTDAPASEQDVSSWLLYPKVFEEFANHRRLHGDTSGLPTLTFFYGQSPGDEIAVDIEPGKTLIIRFLTVSEPHPDGSRTVFFELNGQPRDVTVIDRKLEPTQPRRVKADNADPAQVGAAMPGMVINVAVHEGDKVKAGQKMMVLEAMKMEASVTAPRDGVVKSVHVTKGSQVEAGDLLVVFQNGDSGAAKA
jgi:pyruvate carboxylase